MKKTFLIAFAALCFAFDLATALLVLAMAWTA